MLATSTAAENENKICEMARRIFRRAADGKWVDLIKYTTKILVEHPGCEIYVGCDSQNVDSKTVYATVVVFRYGRNGAHVIYFKDEVKRISDLWTKLWGEVQRTIDVAGYLKIEGGIDVSRIDLDYNKNPKFKSNVVLKAAVGYVESLGYNYAVKPDLLPSIRVANKLCRYRVGKKEGQEALIED